MGCSVPTYVGRSVPLGILEHIEHRAQNRAETNRTTKGTIKIIRTDAVWFCVQLHLEHGDWTLCHDCRRRNRHGTPQIQTAKHQRTDEYVTQFLQKFLSISLTSAARHPLSPPA